MLVMELSKSFSRKKYVLAFQNRISELKREAEELNGLVTKRQELVMKKQRVMPWLWLSLYVVLFAVIIFQNSYFVSHLSKLNVQLFQEQESIKTFYDENLALRTVEHEQRNELAILIESNEALRNQINELIDERTRTLEYQTQGPFERISEKDISLTKEGVLIKINNPLFARFKDTKSMIPVLNQDSKAIQISPQSERDIRVGDIISFDLDDVTIIHRVIEVGEDEFGWYAVTKGDNALNPDKEKVRFSQIRKLLVVIVY